MCFETENVAVIGGDAVHIGIKPQLTCLSKI